MAFIYKITNKINGKFYIGFTSQTNPLRRFKQHLNAAKYDRKNNQPIIRAIQKYGYDNFEFKVLLEGEDKFLLKIEEPRLIKELSPHYNATLGGDGILGYKHTEETKLKFLSRIGRKESEEHKKLRALKIKEAHKNQSIEKKKKLALQTLESNTQRIEIIIEGIKFKSINSAARWALNKYNVGRSTAIRYIKEGRSFNNKKLNHNYNGKYTGSKYV